MVNGTGALSGHYSGMCIPLWAVSEDVGLSTDFFLALMALEGRSLSFPFVHVMGCAYRVIVSGCRMALVGSLPSLGGVLCITFLFKLSQLLYWSVSWTARLVPSLALAS